LSRHRNGRAAGGDSFDGAPTFNSIAVLAFVGIIASVVMIYSVGPGDRRATQTSTLPRVPAVAGPLSPAGPSPSASDLVLTPSGSPGSPAPAPVPVMTTAKPTTAAPPAAPVPPTTDSPRPPPLLVTANYVTRTDWGDGFVADIDVRNVSSQPQTWVVDLRYPSYDIRITDGPWNATVERIGSTFRFRATWVLKPGEIVQFGFVAAKYRYSSSTPTSCAVNGSAC
jgi:hypothetical protein